MSIRTPRAVGNERLQFDNQARIAKPVEGDDATGQWNMLMPMGRWFGHPAIPKEGLDITRAMLETIVENWKAEGKPALPLDYVHDEKGVASGWIEDLEVRADGLWGRTPWTAKARAQILADERRYISPSFSRNAINRRTGQPQGPTLWGAALLNDPFFNTMPRVAASTQQADSADNQQEQNMDKKKICAALGLPEDTNDEAVMAALEAKCKASAELLAAENKVKASNAAKDKAAGELEEAKRINASLTERVAAIEASAKADTEKRLAADTDALVGELLKAGRILAVEVDTVVKPSIQALGLEQARKMLCAFPARVQVDAKGHGGAGETATGGDALRAEYEAALDAEKKANPEVPFMAREKKVRASNPKFKQLS